MSRGAKHRDVLDIFNFPVDDQPCPKLPPSIRRPRPLSVRTPSIAKGKLTTAERLKMAKEMNGKRLTQSILRRQKREREKAEKEKEEAYRRVLVRRKEDPNLVWDLTIDAPIRNQPTQPSQPDELVSDDDEDDQDFVQHIQPRTLFTSPERVEHVSRRPGTSPLRDSAATQLTEVSDDENVPTTRLKKRRIDQPQKRIGLPINSAVFAPSVRNALSIKSTEQKISPRSAPTKPRAPLATVNGSRKTAQHISRTSGRYQGTNAQRERTHPRSKVKKPDCSNTSNAREMVLHISTVPPSDDEDIQEIHQISDDDFVASHRDRRKPKDYTREASMSVKSSRQALKRPRQHRQRDRGIPAKTFYGKNAESSSSYKRGRDLAHVPLLKAQTAKAPSREIARLSLQEQEPNQPKGLRDRNAEKPTRRLVKGRIQYESSDEDDDSIGSKVGDIRFKPLSTPELETVKSLTFKVPKSKVMAKVPEANIELKAGDFSGLRGSRWLNDEILNSFVALINARNRLQLGLSSKENSAPGGAKKDDDDDDDEIMEVAVTSAKPMEVFRRPRPQTHVFNTFFFLRLSQHGYDYNGVRRWLKRAGRDIKSLDLIMFPINLSNFHWVLAAIDLRGKQFLYLDSTYGEDSSGTIPLLRRWLHDEVADKHGDSAAAGMQIDSWGSIVNPSYLPRQRDGGSCGIFTLYMAEYLERGKRPDFRQEHIRTLRQRTALFLKEGKLPDC